MQSLTGASPFNAATDFPASTQRSSLSWAQDSAAAAADEGIPKSPALLLHEQLSAEVLKLNTLTQKIEDQKKVQDIQFLLTMNRNRLESECRSMQLEINSITLKIMTNQKTLSDLEAQIDPDQKAVAAENLVSVESGEDVLKLKDASYALHSLYFHGSNATLMKTIKMLSESKRLMSIELKNKHEEIDKLSSKLEELERQSSLEMPASSPSSAMSDEEMESLNRNQRAVSSLPAGEASFLIGFTYLSNPPRTSQPLDWPAPVISPLLSAVRSSSEKRKKKASEKISSPAKKARIKNQKIISTQSKRVSTYILRSWSYLKIRVGSLG
jgi:hypothetical protein